MKRKNRVFGRGTLLVLMFTLISCSHRKYERTVYIVSPDRTHSITIITNDSIRYIIDGEHENTPDSNYVKLNVGNAPSIDEDILICWDIEGYEWKLVHQALDIIENKLDTLSFYYDAELEKDERGIPTAKNYRGDNCTTVTLYYNLGVRLGLEKGYNIYPEGSAIVYR
ncbi:MAG: hypothetical protein CL666_01360 [Balneola sp.]|nr:hypothetical protein [Balneola sp.]|tara:strand:- start:17556 stop:18059 length:504 start_codon:yes stop_codon:yes gene_type:complete